MALENAGALLHENDSAMAIKNERRWAAEARIRDRSRAKDVQSVAGLVSAVFNLCARTAGHSA